MPPRYLDSGALQTAAALDGGAVTRVFLSDLRFGLLISLLVFLIWVLALRDSMERCIIPRTGKLHWIWEKKKSDSRFWRLCV